MIVDAKALDDAIELMQLAADRIDSLEPADALTKGLRGAAADLRVWSVPEPD